MQSRLKERLTGAAIFVALIVLVVPELFHGPHPELPTRAGSSGEGPPLRSYSIDLTNGAARTEPLPAAEVANRTAPESARAGAAEPAATSAASSREAAPHAGETESAPAAATPAAALANPSSGPHVGATAPPSVARGSGASAPGGWSVQLGLFAKRENAERLMHQALAKGFMASIAAPATTGGLLRVQVAGLPDRGDAQGLAERLKAQGFAARVTGP